MWSIAFFPSAVWTVVIAERVLAGRDIARSSRGGIGVCGGRVGLDGRVGGVGARGGGLDGLLGSLDRGDLGDGSGIGGRILRAAADDLRPGDRDPGEDPLEQATAAVMRHAQLDVVEVLAGVEGVQDRLHVVALVRAREVLLLRIRRRDGVGERGSQLRVGGEERGVVGERIGERGGRAGERRRRNLERLEAAGRQGGLVLRLVPDQPRLRLPRVDLMLVVIHRPLRGPLGRLRRGEGRLRLGDLLGSRAGDRAGSGPVWGERRACRRLCPGQRGPGGGDVGLCLLEACADRPRGPSSSAPPASPPRRPRAAACRACCRSGAAHRRR